MSEMTETQMRERIADAVEEHGSQVALAQKMEITPAYLNDILKREKPISDKIADFFGWTLVKIYRKKPQEKTND